MKRFSLLLLVFLVGATSLVRGQTTEELKARKKELKDQISDLESQIGNLKGEVSDIEAQLVVLPRWETGAFGVVGLNFQQFSDWLARDKPSTASSSIGVTANAFANLFTEKSFWRNSLNSNFGWVKFNDKDDPDDSPGFEQTADVINLASLYGYKLSEKLAISTLGEYRSTLLSNFNNPGYLDVGVGATWTPIPNLVVVAHPLNFNFVFSNDDFDYDSSLGAKIMADYNQEVTSGVNWRSNLSLFTSYQDFSKLSNWTWVNGLGFNMWKGLGVGFELGLRQNKQEALAAGLTDNPLQVYWTLGFSYSI